MNPEHAQGHAEISLQFKAIIYFLCLITYERWVLYKAYIEPHTIQKTKQEEHMLKNCYGEETEPQPLYKLFGIYINPCEFKSG